MALVRSSLLVLVLSSCTAPPHAVDASDRAVAPRLTDRAYLTGAWSVHETEDGETTGLGAMLGDVNGDGFGDLAVIAGDAATIYAGAADGPGAIPMVSLGPAADVAGLGDVDGDGYQDVGVILGGEVSFYVGGPGGVDPTPTGTWTSGETYPELRLRGVGDVTGDGYDDVVVGDTADASRATVPLFCGSRTGLIGLPCGAVDVGTSTRSFGWDVAPLGDLDGDGLGDVAVSAPSVSSRGAVYVLAGDASGALSTVLATLTAASANWLGTGLATADADGDGDLDLFALGTVGTVGAILLFEADAGALTNTHAPIRHDWPAAVPFGTVLAAGDLDGDGDADLATDGDLILFRSDAGSYGSIWVEADATGEEAGEDLEMGDVNGDGRADVLLGGADGRMWLFAGSVDGVEDPFDIDGALQIEGAAGAAEIGAALAIIGDMDGDGDDELAVGATSTPGSISIYAGDPAGADGTADMVWKSSDAWFGTTFDAAGDVNGDGYGDLLIGDWNYTSSSSDQGSAAVYFGSASGYPETASVTWLGGAGEGCGYEVAGLGDLNADGYDDVGFTCSDGDSWIYPGSATGPGSAWAWRDTEGQRQLAAGDFDGDGHPELFSTSPYTSWTTQKIYMYAGSSAGVATTATWSTSWEVWGSQGTIHVGDVNGDAYADLILHCQACTSTSRKGLLGIYWGGASTPGATLDVEEWGADWYYADVGDLDADGRVDLLYAEGGVVYVRYGSDDGFAAAEVLLDLAGRIEMNVLAVGGDVNADGWPDWALGTSLWDRASGGTDAGIVELHYGGPRDEGGGDTGEPCDSSAWFADTDGDGLGDPASRELACAAPDGFVDNDEDCDDTHALSAETCNGLDDDCDGDVDEAGTGSSWPPDADGDGWGSDGPGVIACAPPAGYASVAGDCDDADAARFPGADERCDGADQDCDGEVDEAPSDGTLVYTDADGDGAGAPDSARYSCTGGLTTADDCDDTRADVGPGAEETCDGVDNNCDGSVDESGGATRWADLDGDGFGGAAQTTAACTPPAGWVDNAEDCDDTSALRHPGASERCDGVDDDCDAATDEDAGTAWYADADGDLLGDPAAVTIACVAPVASVANALDCDDNAPLADESCNGLDDDCDGEVDEGSPVDAPTRYEDLDGDGFGATAARSCGGPGWADVGGDCDDADPTLHPDAPETCDGVDEDCDGAVDNAPTDGIAAWIDLDGDGAGGDATTACALDDLYVATGGDCDDADPSAAPGLVELCGGGDEDCSGAVDDNASDGTTLYYDGDSDGFGSERDSRVSCDALDGYVQDGTDCDDTDAAIGGPVLVYADADGDGHGVGEGTASCDGGVTVADDCDDAAADRFPGADEVWYDGVDQDCDGNDADQDGDGVALDGDCDDEDPSVVTPCAAEEKPGGDEGCGCGTTPPSAAWLLGLAVLRWRRRAGGAR